MSGSGGPPVPPPPPPTSHHPHTRQVPPVPPPLPTNSAWNHLQVPNYYPTTRQPTWHTPTTEPLPQKLLPPVTTHSHIFSLEQMLQERQYQPRHSPGVDLTTRNQQQNGETTTTTTTTTSSTTTTTTPISLSVRDTNKINSLPVSALEIQPTEVNLKQLSPILINNDHTINNIKKQPPQQLQRSNKRVDSILERLNPNLDKQQDCSDTSDDKSDKNNGRSVIVQPTNSSNDENSNSSSIVLNTTIGQTTATTTTDDIVSTFSNEDSLDSNKSRRKRKPSKTIRVQTTKDDDFNKEPQSQPPASQQPELTEEKKITERRRSGDDCCGDDEVPKRRKTSSESETIDNIAAMVQESLKASPATTTTTTTTTTTVENKAISVSVIKTNETTTTDSLITTTQTKQQNPFVEVENKLEEMFAGIEDDQKQQQQQQQSDEIGEKDESPELEELVDLGVDKIDGVHKEQRIGQDRNVTSTSNDLIQTKTKKSLKKTKRKRKNFNSKRENFVNGETLVKRKKINKNGKKQTSTPIKTKKTKLEQIKDVYNYDSASNSSNRSQQQQPQQQQQQQQQRGPFIQIKGPRDSPISVNIINAYDDDDNKRLNQQQHRRNHLNNSKRKFFDDNEYRMKIRRKGLHSSTLSQQYDANCKDTTWICVFCKRGPHSTQLNGTTILTNYSNGDLFGPYFITKSTDDEFNHLVNDPYDKQFKSKKIAKILDNCNNQKNNITNGKKAKRKHSIESTSTNSTNTIIATTTTPTINTNNNNNNNISNSHININNNNNNDSDDIYLGMLDTGNNSYEIWAHEDCIIWSPNVYLIGPKIYGLDDSIWTSCNLLCIICNLKGANIHCLKRGCFNIAHVCCAKLNHWQFDDDQFKTYCPEHRVL